MMLSMHFINNDMQKNSPSNIVITVFLFQRRIRQWCLLVVLLAVVCVCVQFLFLLPSLKTASSLFFVLKDRIFQKSSPLRHGAELTKQIENAKPMVLLVTDGGGDHNVTNASVQANLIATFVKLDLDFLFAMRTCPT